MKTKAVTSLIVLFSLWTGIAVAQEGGMPAQEQAMAGHEHGGHHMDPQQHVQHLTKKLNLTSDQQSKVLTILQDHQKQMEAAHGDTALSPQDRHSKLMDLHKSTNEQIRALLNSDQQKKFDEMTAREQERMAGHHGDWGKDKPQTPPQQ